VEACSAIVVGWEDVDLAVTRSRLILVVLLREWRGEGILFVQAEHSSACQHSRILSYAAFVPLHISHNLYTLSSAVVILLAMSSPSSLYGSLYSANLGPVLGGMLWLCAASMENPVHASERSAAIYRLRREVTLQN
jgi:hypothetical protein